jgi:hypothetical protein
MFHPQDFISTADEDSTISGCGRNRRIDYSKRFLLLRGETGDGGMRTEYIDTNSQK